MLADCFDFSDPRANGNSSAGDKPEGEPSNSKRAREEEEDGSAEEPAAKKIDAKSPAEVVVA